MKQLRASHDDLQRRIDAVPARESEMTELMRDYDDADAHLQRPARQERGVEDRGEPRDAADSASSSRSLDPARVPERPISPNRPLINLGGMAAGLAVGLVLVALLEYRDRSFKTDDEIISLLALPVLAVVPLMESDDERRRTPAAAVLSRRRPGQHGGRLSGRA